MTSEGAEPRAVGSIVYNRYRILRVVGRGGLGTVYQVADIIYGANTIFALKELVDTNPGARKQFELESRWLRELNHDSIPKVRESFEWDNRVYLVMDFVDGENLEQYLHRTRRPLPEAQALRWMLPICDALYYLHTRTPPLLHRDVKPANIIVTPGGHPVLVDFGIAKAHLPGKNQTVTFVRKAGTEGYAPPEQYAATGMTGPWSDVYALGATLYQLLTGRIPRTAVERITETDPMPRPSDLVPTISPMTDQAILKAMDLKPAARYQSVMEFASALTDSLRVLGGLGSMGVSAYSGPSNPNSVPGSSRPTGVISFPPLPPVSGTGLAGRQPLPSLGEPLPNNLDPNSAPPMSGPPLGSGAMRAVNSPMPASAPSAPSAYPVGSLYSAPPAPPAPMRTPVSAPRLLPSPAAARPTGQLAMPLDHVPSADDVARAHSRAPIVTGLIVVALLLVAIGAWYAYTNLTAINRSTPTATVQGYFHALKARDYTTAWEYDAGSRNDPSSQTAFTQSLQTDDANYGVVQTATITNVTMSTTSEAVVTTTVVRGPDKTQMTYIMDLNEYNGSVWLITDISNQ